MKTGLESLDTGAPEITYSGNQGPKSPQEDQQKMAEFQLQEYMEEFERVFPDMKDQRGTPDYMKELQDYFEGLASKQNEGIGNMKMASYKPGDYSDEELEEYENYKYDMEEQRPGMPVIDIDDFFKMERSTMKEGGVMQLVKENKDGLRPGYRGIGGYQEGKSGPASSGGTTGGGNGDMQDYMTDQSNLSVGPNTISDEDARRALANNPSLQASIDRAKSIKDEQAKAAEAKKKELDKQLQDISRKNKFNKGISTLAKAFLPAPIKVMMAINKFANPPQTIQDYMEDETDTTTGITDPQAADYFENINKPPAPPTGGDGQDFISPNMAQIAGPTTTDLNVAEDVTGDENTFELRPDDFVSRFSIPDEFRQRAAFGGIMGLDGRRAYGLGSRLKRAFKKITKSPLGKIALAVGLNYAPTLFGKNTVLSGLTSMIPGSKKAIDIKKIKELYPNLSDDKLYDIANKPKKPGLGTLAALTLPAIAGGLYTKKTEEEQPTLDEAMAQTSRGSSPFDQYGGVQGFREMIGRGNLDRSLFPFLQPTSYAADGGRIGLKEGGIGNLRGALSKQMFGYDDEDEDIIKLALGGSAGMPPVTMMSEGMDLMSFPDDESTGMTQATPTTPNQMPMPMPMKQPMMDPRMMQMMMAQRGNPMMNRSMMQQPRIMAQEGGMMDMGGMEKDYRNEGGFVPIGGQERADDVPARLSKNEFVFTADAVRNAGGGDIDKGAEIMENMMENLEQGGKVSKGSQGLSGAREMFATQQRLGEVL